MNIKTIKFASFTDQRPGTSGLRKTVLHYQQPHYTESFIQSIFTSLGGVAGKTMVLGGDGRVLVRPSGTEPLIRVMAEGSDQAQLEEVCGAIVEVVKREQGEA